jgi:hypothetical protein
VQTARPEADFCTIVPQYSTSVRSSPLIPRGSKARPPPTRGRH